MEFHVFSPSGPGVAISVTQNASNPAVQAAGPTSGPKIQYRFINVNLTAPAQVWVGYGPTAAAALANAVTPVDGTHEVFSLLPNSAEVLTFPPGTFFSAIAAAGQTSSLEITPGIGT